MLCQKCHKNLASVRYAEVVDGKVSEQQLCQDCLASRQQETAMGFELSGAPGLKKPQKEPVTQESVHTQEQACPSCGVLASHILETGRAGCPHCYDHFGSQVESILEGLHQALRHKGKMAKLDDTRARLRADLQTKRALLRSVLRAENYEEAARLRDEIRILENGLLASEKGAD
jgi:protein arginine kinase activator